MGQKINPISNRLGITRGWDSVWYGGKNFGEKIVEDKKIRSYLYERHSKSSLSRIIIERTLKIVTVTIFTAKPGLIIGKNGELVNKLKEELVKLTGKEVQINIYEVKRPDLDATIVANNIARQLEGRVAYRRAIKLALASAQRNQAEGRTPLHTFRADIDYCQAEAHTKMGVIGVKVWICRGEVYGKRDLTLPVIDKAQKPAGDRDNGFRGDRGPRRKRNNNQQH